MSQSEPSFFVTAYRLAIMLGVLVCGSLAAFRYGPEPERLAEIIDSAAGMVAEVQSAEGGSPDSDFAVIDPEPSVAESTTTPIEAPRFDAAVTPASALVPIGRQEAPPLVESGDSLEEARLTAPLLAAGATRAEVRPWGAGETKMYRAAAAVPAGEGSTGLERQLDAIGETPEAAIAALQTQVREAMYR